MRDSVLFKVPGRVILYIDRVKMIDTTNDDPKLASLLKDRSYTLVTAEDNPPETNLAYTFWNGERFEFPHDLSLLKWVALYT